MSQGLAKRLPLYAQKRFFWDAVALVVVLVLSVPPLLWFAGNWYVTPDGSFYLLQGWHLISGQGYTSLGDVPQTRRGPGLSVLLGLLMLIFGRDVDGLAWAVRALAILNPWLAYFLIRRLSGPVAGLLAAGLIALFGYTAVLAQAFNVDAVGLTVYLLSVLALLAAVEGGGVRIAALSGVLLGVAIITKETAIAGLPLGLLTALLLGWNSRGVLWHYAGVLLVCLPWWAWVWSVDGEIYLIGKPPAGSIYPVLAASAALVAVAVLLYGSGLPGRLFAGRRWVVWVLTGAWVFSLSALLLASNTPLLKPTLGDAQRYVTSVLLRDTPLWPLLIVAGFYVAWRAIRRDRLWQFYSIVLVLQVPSSLLVFLLGYNPRQYMVPQTLLFGALAVLVVELCRAVARGRVAHPRLEIPIALVLVVSLSVGAVSQVRALSEGTGEEARYDTASQLEDHNNPYVEEMHGWVSRNVPTTENVLTTWLYSAQFAFLDGPKHDWTSLELNCKTGPLDPGLAPGRTGCAPSRGVFLNPPKPTVWFQMPRVPTASSRGADRCGAVALALPDLLGQMERSDSEYLMLSPDWQYTGVLGWTPYLVESGAFKIVHATPTSRDKNTGISVGLILLKRTGKPAKAMPTRMDAYTVLQLVRCERQRSGSQYAKEIRNSFPNGVELDTRSVIGPRPDAQARHETRVQKVIERIYRSNGK